MGNLRGHKKERPTRGKRFRREQRRKQRSRQRFGIIGGIVLGVLLLGAYALRPQATSAEVSESRLVDDPAKGPLNAPVVITEFGDFNCPSCRWWHEQRIFDQIQAAYGEQVRIEWRDFPVITPQSPKAAEAAQCAYDQGVFWEYHDILFERAPQLGLRDLKRYAGELGLDMGAFEACLDSDRHKDTVDRDMRQAFSLGLRGTPSFLVNGQAIIGVNPNHVFQTIDVILASQ